MSLEFFATAAQVIPLLLLGMAIEGNALNVLIYNGRINADPIASYQLYRGLYLYTALCLTAAGELTCFVALAIGAPVPWWLSIVVWVAIVVLGGLFLAMLAIYITFAMEPLEKDAWERESIELDLKFPHRAEQGPTPPQCPTPPQGPIS